MSSENKNIEEFALLSEIKFLQAQLEKTSDSDVIDRKSLQNRIRVVQQKLDALKAGMIGADEFMAGLIARVGVEEEFERRYGDKYKLTSQRLEEIKDRTRSVPWPVSELGSTDFEDPTKFDRKVLHFLRHAVDDVTDLLCEIDRLKRKILTHHEISAAGREPSLADKWLWKVIIDEKGAPDED